ncbi:inositol 2-dehydrogenase-like [Ylistrum balloti]|uniref:inositol 2-dehydrogenase-like n=1 Tax=Ylistrum balloti TaxID=509963 RepID=UPI002905EB38|nr:inositol 2-dehydrogenase-like [Ylistrum balloti]
MMSHVEVGAALVGVGRIGKVHLRNLVDISEFRIRWLVDVVESHEEISELVRKYRLNDEAKVTTPEDLDRVMDDSRVKVVIVCTPTIYHEHVIMKALKAGKHVFCEKPLALTLESVKNCYAEATRQRKILFCAVNRRFDSQFRQIRDDLLIGKYGSLRVIKMTSHDLGQPVQYLKHSTGGIFLDMGIHDIDYVCWLAGEKPNSLMATVTRSSEKAETYKSLGEYDSASAILTFPSGVIGQLEMSRESGYGYSQTVEVFGTKMIAKSKDMMATKVECSCAESGTNIGKLNDSYVTRYLQSFHTEMEHFLDVVKGKAICDVTPEGYIIASEISEMLMKSALTGEVLKLG